MDEENLGIPANFEDLGNEVIPCGQVTNADGHENYV